VINRFFDPTLLESALLYVGNVVAQFFCHVERKDRKTEEFILESLVRKIYKSKMPSIVQSLVIVFSRFINLYPEEILKFLTKFQIENKVGLKVLIDKWLLHQPLFRGTYFKNISMKALTILFGLKNEILESLMVIGYDPSHSNASVEVNAPFKILSVLIRCLNNELLQERMKQEKNDYDNLNFEDNVYNNQYDENEGEGEENEQLEFNDMKEDDVNDNNNIEDNNEDKKLDIGMDEFKNIQEDPNDLTTKLNFINLQGKSGGLNNLETGSEVYMSEMLVKYIF
jgi:hypothetical protein